MEEPLGELLHAPERDALSLLDRQRMIGGLELHGDQHICAAASVWGGVGRAPPSTGKRNSDRTWAVP
jgi:hypothetical protein